MGQAHFRPRRRSGKRYAGLADIAADDRHRPEDRLAERARLDAHHPFKLVRNRLPRKRPCYRLAEARHILEIDDDVDRNFGFAACLQRQTQWEMDRGRPLPFEVQCAAQRAEREPERVWVRHFCPKSYRGAADRRTDGWS